MLVLPTESIQKRLEYEKTNFNTKRYYDLVDKSGFKRKECSSHETEKLVDSVIYRRLIKLSSVCGSHGFIVIVRTIFW